jgi:hypothetical protein
MSTTAGERGPQQRNCDGASPRRTLDDIAMSFPAVRTLAAVLIALAVTVSGTADQAYATRGRHARDTQPRVSVPLGYGVDIQATFDNSGNPQLVANFSPDGALAKPRWATCRPLDVSVCTPASSSQFLNAGPTAAGTVFQASATYRGKTYTGRTSPWQGTVQATSAPRVNGTPHYPASITASGASWTGGWGGEYDFLSIEACRTTAATACVNLSPQSGYGYSARTVHPGTWFDGWYLFAFDQRLAKDAAFAEPGYLTAAAVPTVRAGPTVARSAPAGPVTGPPPPRISFLHTATTHAGKVLVARVRCSARCHVFLQVFDNQVGIIGEVSVIRSQLVGVPREKLHSGPLRVTIFIDDGPYVHGTTRLH